MQHDTDKALTAEQIVREILGWPGKLLSGSKSSYSKSHPKNIVFFNGNVYGSDGRKLWYGDIDLTRDGKNLKYLAHQLQESIYVTAEQPFRWEAQTKESLEEACAETAYSRAVKFDP